MIKIEDIARPAERLTEIDPERLAPLPPPYDGADALPPRKRLTDKARANCDSSLDGFLAVGMARPQTEAEEQQLIERFIAGLERLLSPDDNWAFLQQLTLSLDHCARCQTCVESCPIYTASGRNEVYRPTFRSEDFSPHRKKVRQARRQIAGEAEGRGHRSQRHHDSPAAGIGLPVHALPPLRPGLPDGRGQRAADARDPQTVQHGTGHRSQGTSRAGIGAATSRGIEHRLETSCCEGHRSSFSTRRSASRRGSTSIRRGTSPERTFS